MLSRTILTILQKKYYGPKRRGTEILNSPENLISMELWHEKVGHIEFYHLFLFFLCYRIFILYNDDQWLGIANLERLFQSLLHKIFCTGIYVIVCIVSAHIRYLHQILKFNARIVQVTYKNVGTCIWFVMQKCRVMIHMVQNRGDARKLHQDR